MHKQRNTSLDLQQNLKEVLIGPSTKVNLIEIVDEFLLNKGTLDKNFSFKIVFYPYQTQSAGDEQDMNVADSPANINRMHRFTAKANCT